MAGTGYYGQAGNGVGRCVVPKPAFSAAGLYAVALNPGNDATIAAALRQAPIDVSPPKPRSAETLQVLAYSEPSFLLRPVLRLVYMPVRGHSCCTAAACLPAQPQPLSRQMCAFDPSLNPH